MAHRRLGEPEWFHQVAHARFSLRLRRDEAQEAEPARIGDRLEGARQLFGIVSSHAAPKNRRAAGTGLLRHRHTSILTDVDQMGKYIDTCRYPIDHKESP